MARLKAMVLGLILLPLCGCDADKINDLEKQNTDLKAQLAKEKDTTRDFDLQAKCSSAAKAWFRENWGTNTDKNTMLLDFSNHYNKGSNQCFIFVENHRRVGTGSSWANNMSLWDVFENSKYGDFAEGHMLDLQFKDDPTVHTCEVLGKKCTTADKFNEMAQPYMNN